MLGRIGARIARGNNILTDVNEIETNVRLITVPNLVPVIFVCSKSPRMFVDADAPGRHGAAPRPDRAQQRERIPRQCLGRGGCARGIFRRPAPPGARDRPQSGV